MINIASYIKKYSSVLSYIFFGVCTTVVNVATYCLLFDIGGIGNVPANIVAWVVAVAFAYITNKLFVFSSKSFEGSVIIREIISFVSCRLLTGILDIAIMFVAVDVMKQNAMIWKVISNVLVILLNYVASKLFIFKKA